jgi:hypothetical protein
MVSGDLMKRGYHVFRALSPSCPCDLAVLKDNNLVLIEVTTGYRGKDGKHSFPEHKNGRYDVVAVVFHDGEIIYKPSLP